MKFYLLIFAFLLSNKTIEGVESEKLNRFHICTVASHVNSNLKKLEESCLQHHCELEVLGMGIPYYGNGTKLLYMIDYLSTLDERDIVMFVDAFDVLIISDKETILETFLKMKARIVMSAEISCYPYVHLAHQFPISPTKHRYINSGSYIGYVKDLKRWLNALQPIQASKSDQGQIGMQFLNGEKHFILDYYCKLFLPLYFVKIEDVTINEQNGNVFYHETESSPCVLHACGHSFEIFNRAYEKLIRGK